MKAKFKKNNFIFHSDFEHFQYSKTGGKATLKLMFIEEPMWKDFKDEMIQANGLEMLEMKFKIKQGKVCDDAVRSIIYNVIDISQLLPED